MRANLLLLFLTVSGVSCAPVTDQGSAGTTEVNTIVIEGAGPRVQARVSRQADASEYSIPASADAVFGALPGAYEEMGLEPTAIDTRSRVLAVENATVRRLGGQTPSRYLDCGGGFGAAADRLDVRLSMSTSVTPDTDGSRLRIQVVASGQNRNVSGNAVNCTTNGTFEDRFVSAVLSRIAG